MEPTVLQVVRAKALLYPVFESCHIYINVYIIDVAIILYYYPLKGTLPLYGESYQMSNPVNMVL